MKDCSVYSLGFCFLSACSCLTLEETTARVNEECPTGLDWRWELSDELFRTGELNPCLCNESPDTHKHYLFSC